jgi:peptidoglycan hydrolase CwlO-like protein
MSKDFQKSEDERAPELKGDLEAQLDELGDKPGQVGNRSAGQAGDSQALSSEEDASDESVEELADTEQALEAAVVEGVEDAANHPERPAHTHEEYGRPDDAPPKRNRNVA